MLTVLNVAYPFAKVSRATAGGAEQVLCALDSALVLAGHRSLVLGCGGSSVAGELLPVEVPEGPITSDSRELVYRAYRARLREVLARAPIDVVHFHGVDCAEYLVEAECPSLVTLHLPFDFYDRRLFDSERRFSFVCVSAEQRATYEGGLPIRATIENGVDLRALHPDPTPSRGYLACLGRVCPEKGYEVALAAARASNLPLLLAGTVFPYPEHQRYFREQIVPLLDTERRFVGNLAGEAKRAFLAQAAALVVPSRVAETSGLVAMEALACGTPALVANAGALPALIEAGRTGFVFDDDEHLLQAMAQVAQLSAVDCRRSAETRFDQRRMCDRYLALYQELAREWRSRSVPERSGRLAGQRS